MSPVLLPLRPARVAVPLLYAVLTVLQLVVPALGFDDPAAAAGAGPRGGHAPAQHHAGQHPGHPAGDRTGHGAGRAGDNRIAAARRAGCTMAETAHRATQAADIPFYVGCAFLVQETGGGRNVFGHDPTVFAGAGKVTRDKYLAYKHLRQRTGEMQGVGPMQLTWWSYQDRADQLGGAWRPYPNMLVGFRHLAALHHATGSWRAAAHDYNGSGAMAASYAAQMSRHFDRMRSALG